MPRGLFPDREPLRSLHNSRIRLAKGLMVSRERRYELRKFVIEGTRLVEEALKAGIDLEFIMYASDRGQDGGVMSLLEAASDLGVPIVPVVPELMNRISDTATSQGVIAVGNMPPAGVGAILEIPLEKAPLVLVCDQLRDPGNLGTILRSAWAFGASGAILTAGTCDLYNPKVLRATMGASFHMPVAQSDQPAGEVLREAKNQGFTVVATSARAPLYCHEYDFVRPAVIAIGNEAWGISQQTAEVADDLVSIPMPGRAESLNAAVAASIILYEAAKQRLVRGMQLCYNSS
ncbi:MAG TPA: RNA methyltransferase [Firmicutes bacterium]|nr:RNA methyltransferase [Bacillota bacterium]